MNKPTIKICLVKMRVLQGQEFFTRDEVLLEYLAKRVQAVAESPEHVDRMLDAWLGRTKAMLHVSDVDTLARETAERPAGPLPDPCDECKRVDWVHVNSGVVRCACSRGRKLLELDTARAAREKVEAAH